MTGSRRTEADSPTRALVTILYQALTTGVDSPVVSVNNGGGFNHGAGMNGGYARGW
jgi:hypothetical protein